MLVLVKPMMCYESVQVTEHAEDLNVMGRTIRAISELYDKLRERERSKEIRMDINVKKSNGTK
jgi:hypothetical protein